MSRNKPCGVSRRHSRGFRTSFSLGLGSPQRDQADQALGYAHIFLALFLLPACNRYFEWGLDLSRILKDAEKCWGHVGA